MEIEIDWKLLLDMGDSAKGDAETLYRRALTQAEKQYGPESPTAGVCLVKLADCLESKGKSQEAEIYSDRYRAILCRFAKEMDMGTPPME